MSDSPPVRYRAIDRHRRSEVSLDDQLPVDHPVRVLWEFVERLDLSPFLRPAKAVWGHPGAPVIPTKLLFALWLFAFTEGTLSARRLAQLCQRDLPYQWLCGAEPVNYHTLADFFSQNEAALKQLFVEHVAALRQQELITLSTVTLDGRKIPACASKDHFHRQPTLQNHLEDARAHLQQLEQEQQEQPQRSAQSTAARQRGARERVERLEQALQVVEQRQQQRRENPRERAKPEDARACETDPDCAKMKFSNGGYGLAYNVETVTDADSDLIVSVSVTNQGSDNGQLGVMLEQVAEQQGVLPETVLLDSGFAANADVEQWELAGVVLLMPPKNQRKEQSQGKDPYARKRRDSDAVAAWRARMGTADAQVAYRRRTPIAEGIHAQQWTRGWHRFRLRGLSKALTESYWYAIGHNVSKLLRRGALLTSMVRA